MSLAPLNCPKIPLCITHLVGFRSLSAVPMERELERSKISGLHLAQMGSCHRGSSGACNTSHQPPISSYYLINSDTY